MRSTIKRRVSVGTVVSVGVESDFFEWFPKLLSVASSLQSASVDVSRRALVRFAANMVKRRHEETRKHPDVAKPCR
jgi:hypothetical protein